MKICQHCLRANAEDAVRCVICGSQVFRMAPSAAKAPTAPDPRPTSRRISRRVAGIVICSCLAAVGAKWAGREAQINGLERKLAAQRTKASEEHAAEAAKQDAAEQSRLAQEEAEHQSRLRDEGWLSGSLARKWHENEWALRAAHDPQLAQTVLETNLLTMERLGQDETVAAKTALEKVARLASPPDSRVEIDPDGDGFRVRVAFMMSRLSKNEAGAVTKHHDLYSMRAEIEELSARVLRDLYDYCGSRGIRSIAVTCDHTLRRTVTPEGTTDEERALLLARAHPVTARLYRLRLDEAQARAIVDWRGIPLYRVSQLSTVEYDGLTNLTITHDQTENQNQRDAEGEPEF